MSAGVAVVCAVVGCETQEDPPGRTVEAAQAEHTLELPAPSGASRTEAVSETGASVEPGRGAKIASIAMRTWVYVAPRERSTKLGYLRAGAVVDRGDSAVGTDGCAGGWYRVAPRGYVCVGKGASLQVDHQVVAAAPRGPRRHEPLPYDYVTSGSPPPHLYFRLPTHKEQVRTEGPTLDAHIAKGGSAQFSSVPADTVPVFLAEGRDLPKPYGAEEKLHYSVHAGRAKEASAFGLITTFDWTARRFGLTTELDLIPLDRTRLAHPSALRGLVVEDDGIAAMVVQRGVRALRAHSAGGPLQDDRDVAYRTGVVLTKSRAGGLAETTDGLWIPESALRIADLRDDPIGFAASGRKWIDVSIKKQLLVAYEGRRPAYVTLVSTGVGDMGDPETTHATVRGTFYIHAKHVSARMEGDEASDSYDLRDVPYVQYFHEGYALHGAFWHDDFGKVHSHGCVNLAPADAAWLFEWTDPQVPEEWHGAVNPEGGTLVWIHG